MNNYFENYILRNTNTQEIIELDNASITTSVDQIEINSGLGNHALGVINGEIHHFLSINGEELGEISIPDITRPNEYLFNDELYVFEKANEHLEYESEPQQNKNWLNLLLD